MEKITGLVTALFTPMFFNGRIDWKSLEALVEFQSNHNAGVLSGGTTSESPTIQDVQEEIDKLVIATAIGVPVVIGAGTYDTVHSLELTRRAVGNGADATLHVMGYYNKPSQRGVIDYFCEVAEAGPDTPVIMYHIPGRGAAEYLPETIVFLATEYKNINGIKEASQSSIEVAKKVRELADEHNVGISIMSGDDDKTYQMMADSAIRGNGVISVMSNLAPHMYAKLVELCEEGKLEEAEKLNNILTPLNKIVGMKVEDYVMIGGKTYNFIDTYRNPQTVKISAYILGMMPELGFRSPMIEMPDNGIEAVGKALLQVYDATDGEAFMPIQVFFSPSPSVGDRLKAYHD
ncbi:MAG: dihydrodipicolinate synthase family protein [Candidatus Aenigmarchaeota archaeon]|nr:dihydrodipicolinate synthase family protein [Candidatus Aenigmarchaeota archaeon]MDI6722127.1 dihydrodipicolinate synthase family protein [Candidatus Aenigmarchaeota archaeon]